MSEHKRESDSNATNTWSIFSPSSVNMPPTSPIHVQNVEQLQQYIFPSGKLFIFAIFCEYFNIEGLFLVIYGKKIHFILV